MGFSRLHIRRGQYDAVPVNVEPTDQKGPATAVTTSASSTGLAHSSYRTDLRTANIQWRAHAFPKVLLVVTALLPMIPAIILLDYQVRGVVFTGSLNSWTENSRASVQIVVSIISGVFSCLNYNTVSGLLEYCLRIRMTDRPVRVWVLSLVGLVGTQRLRLEQSFRRTVLILTTLALLFIPHIVWVGAITPVSTYANATVANAFQIPLYNQASSSHWASTGYWTSDVYYYCHLNYSSNDYFTQCPGVTINGPILSDASRASSLVDTSTGVHPKNDLTKYNYKGRSYGVASTVGLVDPSFGNVTDFAYSEPGYLTKVDCSYNESSAWGFELEVNGTLEYGLPASYYAIGLLPNSNISAGVLQESLPAWNSTDDLVGMFVDHFNGTHMLALTAGVDYYILNQTQCTISYNPAMFVVNVDAANGYIVVEPSAAKPPNFDPTRGLANATSWQLNTMAQIDTSLSVSIIGEALMTNIAIYNKSAPAGMSQDDIALRAIEQSLEAMLDDMLVFIGSGQVSFASGNFLQPVDATFSVDAVQLGELPYVATALVVSAVLLLAVVAEAVRTRVWADLPRFDFTDFTAMMLASAKAGPDIVEAVQRRHGIEHWQDVWVGNGSHPHAKGLALGLGMTRGGVALTAV